MSGQLNFGQALRKFRAGSPAIPADGADCRQPEAPPDIHISHGLRLTGIEARLAALEKQISNQNRLLLIGILAIVGELAKQVLHP